MNTRLIALVLVLFIPAGASADVMIMKNGSRIVGTLVSGGGGTIKFDTPWGGTLEVKGENVESIETESSNTVLMEDGEIFRDKQLYATESTLVIQREGGPERRYPIGDIDLVNPHPWLLGEGYRWTGRVNLAFEAQRGNSDTDEWDVDGTTEWRSLEDRFTIRGNLEYDEANGEEVTDNWKLRNKYDRFMGDDPDNYWGGKLRFEYDGQADLDLRTLVGPHVGREFFDSSRLLLRAELGPVYVDEQRDVAEDNDYYGALFEMLAESDILGFGTTLYMFHDTTLNFDEADEPLSNTIIGLRMPIIFGFETAFEAKYEYDGGAPDDTDTTDETYTFKIGYGW
jgi:putative salt-induced outer membrane protein YdiY